MTFKELKELLNQFDSTYDHFDVRIFNNSSGDYIDVESWVMTETAKDFALTFDGDLND